MKRIIFVLLVITVLSIVIVSPVYAAGGKVRGAKAEGPAYQHQEEDPPPFQI